ncbi:retrovirus-related pol polyprotein from transposon TNT 1-94 [Tanacetum coccineum]
MVSTTKCLELLHMDLFGPSAVQSYGENFYTLVIINDYSRYTYTRFLKQKNEAFDHFEILSKKIQVQKGCLIISIHTDHGWEFDNEVQFGAFCNANGITYNFSASRTPQSNGVVERKNQTLQEMSRTMLNEQGIPQNFWCNAVDTSTYILNRILIRHFLGKTPYDLFKGKKPSLEYFKVFGSKCFILNTKDYLTKFDPKSTEGIFLRYSPNSKAYIILNKETMRIEESINVKFDESPPPKSPHLEDNDVLECEIIENQEKVLEIKENEPLNKEIVNIKESKDHPLETIIDENGVVSRNKARLVAQGYNQQEGIDFDETYARVARLESVRILLVYACAHDFKLYQMDVKSAFRNGFINKEVYVAQTPGFIDFEKPNHVFKLKKALYGLKQAPKAWYDRLKSFLIGHKYTMGLDQTINLDDFGHDSIEDKNNNKKKKNDNKKNGKKRKRKPSGGIGHLLSECWKYFDPKMERPDEPNGPLIRMSYCKFCPQVYRADPVKNGTKNINLHYPKCDFNPMNEESIKKLSLTKDMNGDGEGCINGTLQNWKYDEKAIKKSLIELIVLAKLPFKFVQHPLFGLSSKCIQRNLHYNPR